MLDAAAGDEWVEPDDVDEGEGVSRTGISDDSTAGLSVVKILDTAMRLGE